MLNSSAVAGSASSPNFIRPQPSLDSSKSKSGFFRRVFGSSKPSTPRPSTPSYQLPPLSTGNNSMLSTSTSASHAYSHDTSKASSFSKAPSTNFDGYVPPAPAVPANNEPAHVVQKKASFFRRRKKSVSDNLAVDTGLANVPTQDADPQPASASSLRQAMGPFLAQEQAEAIISPTETVFHDSREQQSREGLEETSFKFAPAPRLSESVNRVEPQARRDAEAAALEDPAPARGPHAVDEALCSCAVDAGPAHDADLVADGRLGVPGDRHGPRAAGHDPGDWTRPRKSGCSGRGYEVGP